MLLNSDEIRAKGLILRSRPNNYTSASYYLTVGKIITMDGEIHDHYKIPPRGMVLIVCEEIFNLPNNVLCYATVKNSLSSQGILAINVGIIDPNWKKPTSSSLINFGSQHKLIVKGEKFMRVTFHKFIPCENQNDNDFTDDETEFTAWDKTLEYNKIFNSYLNEKRMESTSSLSSTFLSINQIKEEIATKVLKIFVSHIGVIAAAVAFIGFAINYSDNIKNYFSKKGNIEMKDSTKSKTITNKDTTYEQRNNSMGNNVNRSMEDKK